MFLETIKRGEYDDFDPEIADGVTKPKTTATVVLRLYEAFGGHSQAHLRIASHLGVSKAYITNLLEDEISELKIEHTPNGPDPNSAVVKLDFRGFEVKTVKLVLHLGVLTAATK